MNNSITEVVYVCQCHLKSIRVLPYVFRVGNDISIFSSVLYFRCIIIYGTIHSNIFIQEHFTALSELNKNAIRGGIRRQNKLVNYASGNMWYLLYDSMTWYILFSRFDHAVFEKETHMKFDGRVSNAKQYSQFRDYSNMCEIYIRRQTLQHLSLSRFHRKTCKRKGSPIMVVNVIFGNLWHWYRYSSRATNFWAVNIYNFREAHCTMTPTWLMSLSLFSTRPNNNYHNSLSSLPAFEANFQRSEVFIWRRRIPFTTIKYNWLQSKRLVTASYRFKDTCPSSAWFTSEEVSISAIKIRQ